MGFCGVLMESPWLISQNFLSTGGGPNNHFFPSNIADFKGSVEHRGEVSSHHLGTFFLTWDFYSLPSASPDEFVISYCTPTIIYNKMAQLLWGYMVNVMLFCGVLIFGYI